MSKFAHSTTPSTKSASVAASASQRAPLALRNRHATAAIAGIASMTDRIGKPLTGVIAQVTAAVRPSSMTKA